MADVKIVDIDNVQWNIKDQVARNKIAEIEQLLKTEVVGEIPIVLNSGNSAERTKIISVQKFGKMYIGLIIIENLNAKNIGTLYRTDIGTLNVNVLNNTYSLGFDYKSGNTVRIRISPDKKIFFEESSGVSNGNNGIFAPITWIEP